LFLILFSETRNFPATVKLNLFGRRNDKKNRKSTFVCVCVFCASLRYLCDCVKVPWLCCALTHCNSMYSTFFPQGFSPFVPQWSSKLTVHNFNG
jgi:hypothetical protein